MERQAKRWEQPGDLACPVTVLASGGIDSTACVGFFACRGMPVEGLFVDYGQPAAAAENRSAIAIADHYGLNLRRIRLEGGLPKGRGLIRGRNAFFLMAALIEMRGSSGTIAIGIHSGTPYYDCSEQFVATMQALFDAYTDGAVRVSAPFLTWTKRQIWEFCCEEHVPVSLTYSCEEGSQPCGRCLSCLDLEALRAYI